MRSGVDRKELGLTVRKVRERAGMTQAELAENAGVTDETISRLERGAFEPSLSTILAVAGALGTTVEALAGGESSSTAERTRTVDVGALRPDARRVVTKLVELLEDPAPKRPSKKRPKKR